MTTELPEALRPLFTLFEGLPRGGPGDDAHTHEALRRLPGLPQNPRVLDVGCGPGQQTLVLARELGVTIEAIDVYPPFLEALRRDAAAQGLAGRIVTRQGDMSALGEPDGSVDLIWSEGAIFILGFAAGLALWWPMLKPEGLVMVSEACWFVDDPPADAKAFWDANYPDISTEEQTRAAAERAGYRVLDDFRLERDVWWSSLYTSLQERIETLREAAADDPPLAGTIAQSEQEIEIYRRFGDSYGYTYYLLQRAD